jgi:hypothetical protein
MASEWDLRAPLLSYYQQPATEIHPGQRHSSMHISEWDLRGAATSYYQQFAKGSEHSVHGIPPWH